MIAIDSHNAGKWGERFGFELIKVAIENITFTEDSRELVRQYSSNKMNVKAYDDVTERASNIASQQRIAQGIQNNGLGNAGEMIFGMNLAQGLGTNVEPVKKMTFDEQVETLKRFKELMDVGVLTEEEFNEKKREILGL
jgi:membrane protease subunit (stomatin/prohibitin family)